MHDGHCPNCGFLGSSVVFEIYEGGKPAGHKCPNCEFRTLKEDEDEALRLFNPVLQQSLLLWTQFARYRRQQRVLRTIEKLASTQERSNASKP